MQNSKNMKNEENITTKRSQSSLSNQYQKHDIYNLIDKEQETLFKGNSMSYKKTHKENFTK